MHTHAHRRVAHSVLMHINEVKRAAVGRRQWSRGRLVVSTKPWARGKQDRCREDGAASRGRFRCVLFTKDPSGQEGTC